MVGYLRHTGRRAGAAGAGIIAFLGLIASYAGVQYAGTKTGTALALGATIGPVLLVLAILYPIVFPFGIYALLTPFDTILVIGSASTLTKLLGALSAAALIFYILRTKRFADPDRSVAVWMLYYLWLTASLFWAIDAKMSSDMLPTALLLFGLYVIVSMVRIDMSSLETVAKFVMAGGACASMYALYMYHSGAAIHEDRMWLVTNEVNWNPDHLAAAMLLPLAIATMSAIYGRSLWIKVAGFAAMGIMLPTLVLTGARGPELGLGVVMLYLLLRETQRRPLGMLFGAIFAAGLAFSAKSLSTRWSDALSSGGAGRTDIWHVAWAAFKHDWLFGAGFNNFPLAYDRAMMQVFQPQYIGWNRAPHDILVGNSVELGVVGLVLLLLGWYTQFRTLRNIPSDDPRYRIRIAVEAAVLGLFVSGLFADVMLTKYLWLAFMLVSLTRNAVAVRAPAAGTASGVPVHA